MAHPGSQNSLIHAQDRLVVLMGWRTRWSWTRLTPCWSGDIRRSQEVRELVDELKKKGYGAYTIR